MGNKNFIRLLLVYALICCTAALSAQHKYLGTKTPYQPQQTVYKPAPAGYKPVFINHVGRHGARFLTKPGSDVIVLNTLLLAAQKNGLTVKGKQVKQMAELFESIEKGSYENITLSGHDEQKGIAERMYTRYNNVFKGNGLDVVMTHKVRTQQSANGFLEGMMSYLTGSIHRSIAADSLDDMLRFYDISPAYIAYSNSDILKRREDSLNNDDRIDKVAGNVCSKLFNDVFTQQLQGGIAIELSGKKKMIDAAAFTQSLYDVYAVQFAIHQEMKQKGFDNATINFGIAFEPKDLQWLDLANGAADFFEKGPANDTLGIQVRIAVPLLVDFINTTDSVISGKKSADAKLRFTHAEAISPFATLLGIKKASVPSNSVYRYNKHWQAAAIIPMSANIQWIVYSKGKNYLVKMLLNEKEVGFPVNTNSFPFYKWEDVKNYYVHKLSQLHTGLDSDMHRYLLELK